MKPVRRLDQLPAKCPHAGCRIRILKKMEMAVLISKVNCDFATDRE
jgi:hypothetical protein